MDLYTKEANRQLQNRTFHVPLPSDPTMVFKKKFDRLLKTARDMFIITKKEHLFLEVSHPIIPTFYMLPKVHKDLRNPPGRPIVAGIGGLCEQACTYVDFFLQPIVLGLPSYVRDSLHLIEMLEHLPITTDVLLVTCDVESLYTNIAHKDGIRATTHFLEKSTSEEPAHRTFLGSRETCIQFIDTLNINDLNIHLTYTISDDMVDFLDLKLRKEHERITTYLFRKSTATNNLLHYQSFHPTHMKRGIPKGQFLRLRRNCTNVTDFKTASADLTTRFRKRGYPRKLITRSYEEAKNADRMQLFTPKPKTRDGP
ncbi:uncharacterized protein LOC121005481 [Bufo bufo]|uniref:uncharacterized protein LOC121005481 n=1 Tax=Bufo bufo TaxID=8384 RepID=UPI001ABE2967|nr:uncharacterized protein LOC121005481 [Bufo bufo]